MVKKEETKEVLNIEKDLEELRDYLDAEIHRVHHNS